MSTLAFLAALAHVALSGPTGSASLVVPATKTASSQAVAGLLGAGDIVVAASGPQGPSIVHVDPETGAQTLLANGPVAAPQFMAVDRNETAYVTISSSLPRIERIDLVTGSITTLTSGGHLDQPRGIAVEADGQLLVTDEQNSFFPPSDAILLRVDPSSGAQTVVAQDVFLSRPKDLQLDTDGTAVVIDDTLWGGLFRVDPLTGAQTTISEDPSMTLIGISSYVAFAPGGDVFVNGPGSNGLVRVDVNTGEQFVSLQTLSTSIRSIKSASDGDLFIGHGDGTILRFDPATETVVGTVSTGGLLLDLRAMAVVPPPVTPPQVVCSVQEGVLWPPNHALVDVGLDVTVEHGAPTKVTVTVFSDEDDLEPGSGHHAPDAVDPAPATLRLRAERSGLGDGRVYLIVASATDAFGNSAEHCCSVIVLANQGAQSAATASAQAALAEQVFEQTGSPPAGYVPVGALHGSAGSNAVLQMVPMGAPAVQKR